MSLVEILPHGDVAEVRLARPPVNALDPVLCAALRDAIGVAVRDGAHAIVLSGGPSVFSAGLDVPYLMSLGERARRAACMHGKPSSARRAPSPPVPCQWPRRSPDTHRRAAACSRCAATTA